MIKSLRASCAAMLLLPSACATPGGGPLGFVMFDPKQHVAAAEPLFGDGDQQCLDDPTFLLTLFAREGPADALRQSAYAASINGVGDPKLRKIDICTRMRWALMWGLQSHGKSVTTYDQATRNEVVGAMIAASDRKCGRYVAFLQQYNGNVKAGFGIIGQAADGLATVASGGLNRALTVTSLLSNHTRSELEEAHFANQTLGVLTHAFRSLRTTQKADMESALETKTVTQYTLSQGIADVFTYHASCSIVVGLEQAQKAVTTKDDTDNGDDSGVTPGTTPRPPAQPNKPRVKPSKQHTIVKKGK